MHTTFWLPFRRIIDIYLSHVADMVKNDAFDHPNQLNLLQRNAIAFSEGIDYTIRPKTSHSNVLVVMKPYTIRYEIDSDDPSTGKWIVTRKTP